MAKDRNQAQMRYLREARAALGWTQRQAATSIQAACRGHFRSGAVQACSFDDTQLSRFECGVRAPDSEHIGAISKAYGTDPEELRSIIWHKQPTPGEPDAIWAARTATGPPEAMGGAGTVDLPVSLRPYLERALSRTHVSIDFAGFSGETLHSVIQEPLDRIRAGQLTPSTIAIRMLLYDTSSPTVLPCSVIDQTDDPDFRERAHHIMVRHTQSIIDSANELAELGFVAEVSTQVRAHRCPPLFKLYLLNGEEAFFGFYPVREHAVSVKGETRFMYDLMGKEALMFRHVATEDPAAPGSAYVAQARNWFDSIWGSISHEVPL